MRDDTVSKYTTTTFFVRGTSVSNHSVQPNFNSGYDIYDI
jgi:hypothetical protein